MRHDQTATSDVCDLSVIDRKSLGKLNNVTEAHQNLALNDSEFFTGSAGFIWLEARRGFGSSVVYCESFDYVALSRFG